MNTLNTLEVLGPSGHVTLEWDPKDPESVATARAEFNRLKKCGFVFFTSKAKHAQEWKDFPAKRRRLDARAPDEELEQTSSFRPRRRRTVAVAQMRGG